VQKPVTAMSTANAVCLSIDQAPKGRVARAHPIVF
jgi:hypothetical protein